MKHRQRAFRVFGLNNVGYVKDVVIKCHAGNHFEPTNTQLSLAAGFGLPRLEWTSDYRAMLDRKCVGHMVALPESLRPPAKNTHRTLRFRVKGVGLIQIQCRSPDFQPTPSQLMAETGMSNPVLTECTKATSPQDVRARMIERRIRDVDMRYPNNRRHHHLPMQRERRAFDRRDGIDRRLSS